MSGSRVLSIADIQTEPERIDVRRLRLTLQSDIEQGWRDQPKRKPVGRAYAVVSSRCSSDSVWDQAQARPANEIIKTRSLYDPEINGTISEAQTSQDSSLRQLRAELGRFKEVRYSMERIREQMYGQMNGVKQDVVSYCTRSEGVSGQRDRAGPCPEGNRAAVYRSADTSTQTDCGEDETEKMREATKRLYSKLQEAERRHESERRALENQAGRYQRQLGETKESLRRSEEKVTQRDERIEALQRLMTGMEKEHQILATKVQENEEKLGEMRVLNQEGMADRHRSVQLEKEVETLREKICHLNDMLKSQQRKVRQMIEQLQTSRSQTEEKDLLIQQLQERVEFLESENQEMQDRLEHLSCSEEKPQLCSTDSRGQGGTDQLLYSKRLPLGSKKPKALVRVLETQ